MSLVFVQQVNVIKSKNSMKIDEMAIIDRNSSYLLNGLRNFNENLRKDVTYDNIKSRKKPGFHPLFRRYIF